MPSSFHPRIPELMMASGPCSIYPRVLEAMGWQMVHHRTDEFVELMLSVSDDLSKLFKTANRVLPVEGESILGLEMAAANLVEPGDVCINLASGYYGAGYAKVLRGYGGDVVDVTVPYDTSVSISSVRQALDRHPEAKVLAFVHSETPSASENPMEEICRECRRRGVLTIVDSVSGVGGSTVRFDDWGCDVVVTGTQKCLGSTPGMSLVAVSDRAWERAERVTHDTGRYERSYLSFLPWRQWVDHDYVPYTPPISAIYGIKAALDIIDDEGGVDETVRRHERAARAMRAGVRAMGLDLWVDADEHMANSVTAIRLPDDVEDGRLRGLMDERYGLHVSGGLGEEAGRLIRIGHMGYTASAQKVVAALGVLGSAMIDLGHPVDVTEGLAAANAVFA
ncbi:pyridoxal-phosphate-dependent aminotransferase family protein [Bifidobacterium simiarum]|uniref:pyridoxal-phosphate-dependent aminotransferase family protein n=1 Tax=Bifidobacterium simiarum TaxID=2045441 RepID=UPI001BDBDE78|nr:alanine--glyoxylate aminotransferase family protein [Bifidobacterium simiarum]MBT1167281.1 alanine--glyoxylate aminotransferase family protein [Bifidobacterium simiarum]